MSDVMVRHRRHEVKPTFPGRSVETMTVTATSTEMDLYRQVAQRVRLEGREASPARAALLQRVLQMACSSPAAVRSGLEKLGWDDLDAAAGELDTCAKASALLSVVRRHVELGEKVLVFTGFRRTQQFLSDVLNTAGIETVVYHDRLARRRKDVAVAAFAGPSPVLLTTEAAGEGRNLQFCHVMVNFDLPWNPVQLDHRLGRIHRLGQVQDVTVINLVTRATIEQGILGVIEAKLKLFDLVVGELNMILGRIDDYCFEQLVFEAYAASRDGADFAVRLERLGDQLAEARQDYLTGRQCSDALIGEPRERPCAS
jgi:SNF2 family DNA or RNA helicase